MRHVTLMLLLGCATTPSHIDETATEGSETEAETPTDPEVEADHQAGFSAEDLSLPEPPWAEPALPADTAPAQLIEAWSQADNRGWCAPIAPSDLGEVRARSSDNGGGWMLEFDVRGQPGMRPNGRACARCGRGNFGIAGTAIRVDVEEETEAEERRFRDGSYLRIEADEEADGNQAVANVATIKIRGQECVYQVWSLGGAEALDALILALRFVSVPAE